jgi:hypothetical protein
MLAFIFLGIFIDFVRDFFQEYSARTYNLLPARLFDIISSIVYIALIIFLANLAIHNRMSLLGSIIFSLAGILVLISPLFIFSSLTSYWLSKNLTFLFNPSYIYTHLSGAFWLSSALVNIVKFGKKKAE